MERTDLPGVGLDDTLAGGAARQAGRQNSRSRVRVLGHFSAQLPTHRPAPARVPGSERRVTAPARTGTVEPYQPSRRHVRTRLPTLRSQRPPLTSRIAPVT